MSSAEEATDQIPGLTPEEEQKAARLIQRAYRGHQARRELRGQVLSPSQRWTEAVKDAQFKNATSPTRTNTDSAPATPSTPARQRWRQVTRIARYAGADDKSESEVSISGSDSDAVPGDSTEAKKDEAEKHAAIAKERRKRTAKMMDLQYFLEMVDEKHRYGSSLRKYHARWQEEDTKQNFFYWLDYGDGKDIELEECSRERLAREQVRYLSREERRNYQVRIDDQGQLRWAKDNSKVWTKDELFKDSVNGIVPTDDPSPKWSHHVKTEYHDNSSSSDSSDEDDEDDNKTEEEKSGLEAERYVNEEFHRARGPAKLKHVSAGVFFNHMLRQSLKKGHKWIFVADSSLRLYIGYKQSGAFQHSSFLHGARILAAGLIKVKDGQLRRLSPLSGHYRPPAENFRVFVHSLEDAGCDMSRVSISRSYAILVGLEGYVKTRRKIKKAERAIEHQVDKVVRPEKVKAEEEAKQDHSESAQREREYLAQQEAAGAPPPRKSRTLTKRLSNAWGRFTGKTVGFESDKVTERNVPGTGPEDGVPAPDGERHMHRQM